MIGSPSLTLTVSELWSVFDSLSGVCGHLFTVPRNSVKQQSPLSRAVLSHTHRDTLKLSQGVPSWPSGAIAACSLVSTPGHWFSSGRGPPEESRRRAQSHGLVLFSRRFLPHLPSPGPLYSAFTGKGTQGLARKNGGQRPPGLIQLRV